MGRRKPKRRSRRLYSGPQKPCSYTAHFLRPASQMKPISTDLAVLADLRLLDVINVA